MHARTPRAPNFVRAPALYSIRFFLPVLSFLDLRLYGTCYRAAAVPYHTGYRIILLFRALLFLHIRGDPGEEVPSDRWIALT